MGGKSCCQEGKASSVRQAIRATAQRTRRLSIPGRLVRFSRWERVASNLPPLFLLFLLFSVYLRKRCSKKAGSTVCVNPFADDCRGTCVAFPPQKQKQSPKIVINSKNLRILLLSIAIIFEDFCSEALRTGVHSHRLLAPAPLPEQGRRSATRRAKPLRHAELSLPSRRRARKTVLLRSRLRACSKGSGDDMFRIWSGPGGSSHKGPLPGTRILRAPLWGVFASRRAPTRQRQLKGNEKRRPAPAPTACALHVR